MRWSGLSHPLREAETLEDSEHTSGISSVFPQLAGESLNVGMHLWFIRVWECRYWQDGDFHARFCLLFVSIFPVLVPMNFSGLFWQSLKQNAKEEFATCILFIFFLERRLRKVHYTTKICGQQTPRLYVLVEYLITKRLALMGRQSFLTASPSLVAGVWLFSKVFNRGSGLRFCVSQLVSSTPESLTTFLWTLLWCTSFYFICLCKEISVCNVYMSYSLSQFY